MPRGSGGGRLVKKSGLLFTALYLKQCASSLRQAYGGVFTPPSLLPFPVSLTRSGFPRIIPYFHLHLIYKRDERSDREVQVYCRSFHLQKFENSRNRLTRKCLRA